MVQAFWRTLVGDMCNGGNTMPPAPRTLLSSPATEHLGSSFRDWFTFQAASYLFVTTYIRRKDCVAALHMLDRLSKDDSSVFIRSAEHHRRLAELYALPPKDFPPSISDTTKNRTLYKDVVWEIANARFFTTQGGSMGLGSPSTLEGDSIWLIAGTEVPYILREVPDTGRLMLVGDAYVHGIMRGEAVESAKSKLSIIEIE